MAPTESHLLQPDPEQQRVLEHEGGTLVLTGAAGTGKTWALQERFVRLLQSGIDAAGVALVLRSKAERFAVRDRVQPRVGAVSDLHVVTMQALAFDVAGRLGLGDEGPIEVLDATEQFALVRELLAGEDPGEWPAYGGMLHSHGFAEQLRTFLLRAQEAALEPGVIRARAERVGSTGFVELALFYERYLDVLAASGRTDYPGLVLLAAAAARDREAPLYAHIMVDDHHDTTVANQLLLDALSPASLIIAGRLDGHVFSFQGTTDAPFRALLDDPSHEHVTLTEQHRGQPTLAAWSATHPSEEYAAIARELRRVHAEEDVEWRDLAVVVRRADARLSGVVRALDDAAIPRIAPQHAASSIVEGATGPYVTALLWCARPQMRDALIESLLTSDLARLSPGEARMLVRTAAVAGTPPQEAFDMADELGDPAASQRVHLLRTALDQASTTAEGSVSDTFATLWKGSPSSQRLVAAEAGGDTEARRDLDAIMAFARLIGEHGSSTDPSTDAFLTWLEAGDEAPGVAPADERRNAVRVLTAHASAGREFDTVLIAGAVEGDFPSLTRPEPMFDLAGLDGGIMQSTRTRDRIRDEQRLLDLVLSRARRRVLATASDTFDAGDVSPTRSRFLAATSWSPAPQPPFPQPVSPTEAKASWRRVLARSDASEVERLVALEGLLAIGDDPRDWWYQREWTDPGTRLRDSARVSASRLGTLEDCTLKFLLREELGLESRTSPQMWVGKTVHKIMELVDRDEIPRTEEALRAVTQERWRPDLFASKASSNAFLRLIQEEVWPRWIKEYGQRTTLAPEERFTFIYDDAEVNGAIDRIGAVDGGSEITDYKTGRRPWGDDADPDQNLQLGIYYLALHEVPELQQYLPVKHIELTFVREYASRQGGSFRVEKAFTPTSAAEYEAAIRERLSELIARVDDLYDGAPIEPDPAANCRFCSFKPLCPLYTESLEPIPGDAA